MKGLVVAAAHSGSGKTTFCLALMAALRRKGLKVQGFKVGPDFIDPGHHAELTGRPSHNLDGWMLSKEENLRIFSRYAADADAVIVEGVMGLYDGFDGRSEDGSTAQMAKWLGLPVLLCVDARSMARSLAALALGFVNFDPGLSWAGLVANRVGSPRHTEMLAEAVESAPGLRFWGGLARDDGICLPERHLGLVTADETVWSDEMVGKLGDWVEQGLDLDGLWASLPEMELDRAWAAPAVPPATGRRVRIGVARDEAFCFYYPENLRRIEDAGAELVYFSPIRDRDLPESVEGLYFGGGYPEVFAERLASNESMRSAVYDFGRRGGTIYAECGGFMYMSRGLEDLDGREWPMTGLLPVNVRMLARLRSLGYRQVTLNEDLPLGPAGTAARGHEFHYSEIVRADEPETVVNISARTGIAGGRAGFHKKNVMAGYVHLHFGSNPDLARNLVEYCRTNPPQLHMLGEIK